MQYLNDQHGNPVGVFMSMAEWEAVQKKLDATEREQWQRKAVEKGLAALEAGDFVPKPRIDALFARMGARVD